MLAFYVSMLESEEEKKQIEDIYREYHFLFLRIALKILDNQNLAEDAVHNLFLEIIKNKERYLVMKHEDLEACMMTILKTKSIDIIRKERKYADWNNLPEPEIILNPEEVVSLKLDNEYLICLLNQLSEGDAEIMRLKYILGLSYDEIANQLNLSFDAVKMRLYRAREHVRNLYLKEDKK